MTKPAETPNTPEVTATYRIPAPDEPRAVRPNFITEIIEADLRAGRYQQIVTRFPPEPNGYLHIGHAKAICLNFGVADDYGGRTNLRFDDTNPETEDPEYVEAIKRDIRWLGFEWEEERYASDYFERLYQYAVRLIEAGKAYVDSLDEEQIRAYRGTVTTPGRPSPYRERSVEENLELFEAMRRGEFAEGEHVLRAKIDMAATNMKMRDPLLYRIVHAHHYRTGDAWHIYPLYDFAHPLSDAIEGVTHSLCTLEFENNREIYDWLVENLCDEPRPHQYEFARLVLDYTVMSKRKLIELVRGGHVRGWDDPRLPTLSGLRRRGVRPEAIHEFTNLVGVARANSRTDYALLEHAIRDDLNTVAPRVLAVTDPLKVVLTNWPAERTEMLTAPYWPSDVPRDGSREVAFTRELFIERDDFAEEPPKGWRRLSPGAEVRLRHAYVIRCDEVIEDDRGEVLELRCSVDHDTLGRNPKGRKVRGAIHWVSASRALPAEFRLYDRLFTVPNPDAGDEPFISYLNPESLRVRHGYIEESVAGDAADTRYQFERLGYFWRDPVDATPEALVFNRIVTLKDSWSRSERPAAATDATAKAAAPNEQPEPAEASAKARQPARAGSEPDPAAALPRERLEQFECYLQLGLSRAEAALIAANDDLATLFDAARERHPNPPAIAGWLVNELWRELKERSLDELALTPAALAELVALVDKGTITSRVAKEIFPELLERPLSPAELVRERGLEQLSDEAALRKVIAKLLADHPDEVAAFRGGKEGLIGFFVGQGMRATRGKANPQLLRELLEQALREGG